MVFVFHLVTDCCCCCTSLQIRVPRRFARRPRFSWSLGPSPRQPTVAWPRRDTPPADGAWGTKQRRYTAVPPSNPWIVLLLLHAVVDNNLNSETMPFFRFENLRSKSSDFGPISDDLGRRILKSKKIRSDFAYSDCISRCFLLWGRKIQIYTSKWNRIGSGLILEYYCKRTRLVFAGK